LLKWKLDRKNIIAETEAGLNKNYYLNRSWIDGNSIPEMEAL